MNRFRKVVEDSVRDLRAGAEPRHVLISLETALAEAASEHEVQWVKTIGHHAAVIAEHAGDLERAESLYSLCL